MRFYRDAVGFSTALIQKVKAVFGREVADDILMPMTTTIETDEVIAVATTEQLYRMLENKLSNVAVEAAVILARRGDKKGINWLIQQLEQEFEGLRSGYIWRLSLIMDVMKKLKNPIFNQTLIDFYWILFSPLSAFRYIWFLSDIF